MTHRLRISANALADLDGIADYIARDNPTRARSFTAELRTHARTVASHPMSYRTRPEFGGGVRVAGYRGYLFFYLTTPTEMRLLRIMHGSRDLSELTFD